MRLLMILLSVLYAYMTLYVVQGLLSSTAIETISVSPDGPDVSQAPAVAVTAGSVLPFACTAALVLGLFLARLRRPVLSELVMLVPIGLFAFIAVQSPSYASAVAWHYSSFIQEALSLLG